MRNGRMEMEMIVKLIIGAIVIIVVAYFILYAPEIFEKIKDFFINFSFSEKLK